MGDLQRCMNMEKKGVESLHESVCKDRNKRRCTTSGNSRATITKPVNICKKLFKRELRSTAYQSSDLVCKTFYCEQFPDVPVDVKSALFDLTLLTTVHRDRILSHLEVKLQVLLRIVIGDSFERDRSELQLFVAEMVCSLGLVEVLLNTLVSEYFAVPDAAPQPSEGSEPMITCKSSHIRKARLILQLVHECVQQVPGFSIYHMRWRPRLLEALFSLYSDTSDQAYPFASCILEEIVAGGPPASPVLLRTINGLPELIGKLKGQQLSHFYHVMSALLSDVEFATSCHNSLEKHDEWLCNGAARMSEINHEFLLRLPGFFEKMCEIASRPMHASDAQQPVDFVARILRQSLGLGLNEIDLASIVEENLSDRDGLFFQMSLYQEKTSRADLFFIISLMLTGKFRSEVQERLVNCRLIPRLHAVFQPVLWEDSSNPALRDEHQNMAGHEECNPNTFAKIQFLRLLHSVADSHPNRYLLLSVEEVEELKKYAAKERISIPDELRDLDLTSLPRAKRGILAYTVEKLKNESSTSCVRFWITRALEAFLRSETCPLNQAFLLRKNLVEDTISLMISHLPMFDMVVQGNFDFLSTMMRLNVDAFKRCEKVLDCTAKFRILMSMINSSLVDSNMFVRCIILTVFHIRHHQPQHSDFISSSRLLRHFSEAYQCVELAAKLIRLLTVPTLSQENVSCLNTSLLVFILAHRDSQLPKYLALLLELHDGVSVLRNFDKLLRFWNAHYMLPAKSTDCRSLETSSGVKFAEWQAVVSLLLDDDVTLATSIKHYLAPSMDPRWKASNVLPCNRTS